MMGILTWIKFGAVAILLAGGTFFYFNYQHRGRVIEAQKVQIEQLEAAQKYYEAQAEIDKHTQELKNEVKKATESGDVERVRWLYEQLRMHKNRPGKGKASPAPGNGGTDK